MSKKVFQEASKVDAQTGRIYSGQTIIESDLFKLNVANAMKNIAIQDSGQIELEKVEHIHFFRTVDSDGKKLIHCAPVAGHFHEIKYEEDKDGGPVKILSVSGPLRMGAQRVRGVMKTMPMPLNPDLEDNHTHEIEYLRSHKVESRSANAKALQMIGEEANKISNIPGIQG
jgi:hypothetical protein